MQTALFTLLATGTAWAGSPAQLIFPVACTLGTDCWTVNYPDTDPAPAAASDFQCKSKTYDDHKGTDFGLRNRAVMQAGVDVLAAASGTVLRLRDGEPDGTGGAAALEAIRAQQKECGNAVLLDHGQGLQTLYCHMKNGSVIVKKGDKIDAGQKIGMVGQSGLAEFPHLHFGVMKNARVMDPYTGMQISEGCGKMQQSWWAEGLPMDYDPVALYDGGFTTDAPDFAAVENGDPLPALDGASSALVFWIGIYSAAKDDAIELEIIDPDGNVFSNRSIIQDRNRARQYYYTGRKTGQGLKPGTYTATATLKREPDITRAFSRTIEIR